MTRSYNSGNFASNARISALQKAVIADYYAAYIVSAAIVAYRMICDYSAAKKIAQQARKRRVMKTCELCRMPAKWHIAAMKPVMGLVATTYYLSCGTYNTTKEQLHGIGGIQHGEA